MHGSSFTPPHSLLSDEDRTFVETMTGNVPLLLRPLLNMKTFSKAMLLRCEEMEKVREGIIQFYRKIFKDNHPTTNEDE